MSWERELIARHPGWVQMQVVWMKIISTPQQSHMNTSLYIFVCRISVRKRSKAMRTCLFPCLLPLAVTTASFTNGKAASSLPFPTWKAASLSYGIAADWVFEINTPIDASALPFGVGECLPFQGLLGVPIGFELDLNSVLCRFTLSL